MDGPNSKAAAFDKCRQCCQHNRSTGVVQIWQPVFDRSPCNKPMVRLVVWIDGGELYFSYMYLSFHVEADVVVLFDRQILSSLLTMLLFFIVFQLHGVMLATQFFTTAEMLFAVIGGLLLPLGSTTNTTFIMHQSQQAIITFAFAFAF